MAHRLREQAFGLGFKCNKTQIVSCVCHPRRCEVSFGEGGFFEGNRYSAAPQEQGFRPFCEAKEDFIQCQFVSEPAFKLVHPEEDWPVPVEEEPPALTFVYKALTYTDTLPYNALNNKDTLHTFRII